MNTFQVAFEKQAVSRLDSLPAICITLPFNAKMTSKNKINASIKRISRMAEKMILQQYDGDIGALVIQKLKIIIKDLDYSNYAKSVAIYITPVFEKVLYLSMEMDETVTISTSFDLYSLMQNKKAPINFLILYLTEKHCEIFEGSETDLVQIVSTTPASFYSDAENELQNSVMGDNEITNLFFKHVDNSLDILLQSYDFPLILCGTADIIDRFKTFTSHSAQITETSIITTMMNIQDLQQVILPVIENYDSIKEKFIVKQLEAAEITNKLATGLNEVWNKISTGIGKTLLIAERFHDVYPKNTGQEIMSVFISQFSRFTYIKTPLDLIIEHALQNNCEIELVHQQMLKNYGHIALINN